MSELDTEKADALSSMQKQIIGLIKWERKSKERYRLNTKVFAFNSEEELDLRGVVGKTNYSFSLLYRNQPVRKFTKHYYHRSKSTKEEFREPHKHCWDGNTQDDRAYIPDDIDPQSSIDEQFLAFLKEENITVVGNYLSLDPEREE